MRLVERQGRRGVGRADVETQSLVANPAHRPADDRAPRVRQHHPHLGPDAGAPALGHSGALLRVSSACPDRRRIGQWSATITCNSSRPDSS